jgi:energy-coupling factor transporter ATP-binding protein EcfA2
MLKLKDGLREPIIMNIGEGTNELDFKSIRELMISWYRLEKNNKSYKYITYMGEIISIYYDVVKDEDGEIIEETDFTTIREDLEEQINSINDMFDKGMVK